MAIPSSPELIKSIPDWVFYAQIDLNPLNLNDFIKNADPEDGQIQFSATLADGSELPAGIICTPEGQFHGVTEFDSVSSEPYQILIVAKNNADIPLVAYFNLTISFLDEDTLDAHRLNTEEVTFDLGEQDMSQLMQEIESELQGERAENSDATAQDHSLESYEDTDEEFEQFLASLDSDALKTDPDALAEAVSQGAANLPDFMNDPEYLEFFVRHMLRKFSSLQIYNADESFSELKVLDTFRAKTGWTIYDSKYAFTTTNPEALSSDFSRSKFIATVREMIVAAADRGWRTVGVKGCDRDLGSRLVVEYNRNQDEPAKVLQLDDLFEESSWFDRAKQDVKLRARG